MNELLTVLLLNAGIATALALSVALASRWLRRPAVVHLLWVIVLLKLLSPPLFKLAVIPIDPRHLGGGDEMIAVEATPMPTDYLPSSEVWIPQGAVQRSLPQPTTTLAALVPWAAALWLAGTLLLLALAVARGMRFRRLVARAAPAPPELRERVGELAARMGLRRCPRVRTVRAVISPMLWPRLRSIDLLVPQALLERLDPAGRDAVLAHELAHVRRRDHWVRGLELLATCSFWWHPVVWWARRRLRRAEEQSCDELVLKTLPRRGKDYAHALLETLEFLAGQAHPRPVLASGIGEIRHLEERLTMILRPRPNPLLSRPARLTLLALAVGSLLIFPTVADLQTDGDDEAAERERVEAAERYRLDIVELEREAAELESRLRELRMRQMELEREMQRLYSSAELEQLQEQTEHLEREGRLAEAERMREQAELTERRFATEQKHRELELRMQERMRELEQPLRDRVLELEELRARGVEDTAQLEREIAAMQEELEERARSSEGEWRDFEREKIALQLDELRMQADRLRDEGRDEEAARVALELAMRLAELEQRERRSLDLDEERAQIEFEIQKLMLLLERLEREGRTEEAADVRRAIEALKEFATDRTVGTFSKPEY